MEFDTKEVIAVSCAVHRENKGFYKKFDQEVVYNGRTSNSAMLYAHFFEDKKVDVINADRVEADKIIEYLKGLAFKALERKLTDFESNVLKFVSAQSIGKDMMGIAASLPKVHKNKVESDQWTDREIELGRTSEYVGELHSRNKFTATVEFLKYIPKTSSYLVTASVNNKDILKFFVPNGSDVKKSFKPGESVDIVGYVKSHNESRFSGFKETMINRVKLAD